jgi:hypothetical protein
MTAHRTMTLSRYLPVSAVKKMMHDMKGRNHRKTCQDNYPYYLKHFFIHPSSPRKQSHQVNYASLHDRCRSFSTEPGKVRNISVPATSYSSIPILCPPN